MQGRSGADSQQSLSQSDSGSEIGDTANTGGEGGANLSTSSDLPVVIDR